MRAIPTMGITPMAVGGESLPRELPNSGLWFLLHTKSRQEKILADELHRIGIPNYLPVSRQLRQYGNRRIRIELPLFPGYLFVRGTVEDAYQSNRTHRVARIIPVTDQPRLDWELRNLFLACRNDPAVQPYPYLQKGVRVLVCSGPFRGVEGFVEDRTTPRRLILQVQTLGRAVSIEVDGDVLQAVG